MVKMNSNNYNYQFSYNSQHQLIITDKALINVFKVSAKTIKNGRSKYKNRQSVHWAYIKNEDVIWIIKASIPEKTLTAHGLNTSDEKITASLKIAAQRETQVEKIDSTSLISQSIVEYVNTEWPRFVNTYSEFTVKQIEVFARQEAAFSYAADQANVGLEVSQVHEALLKIVSDDEKLMVDSSLGENNQQYPVLPEIHVGTDVRHFKLRLQKGSVKGFKGIIVNGNKGRPSPHKTSPAVVDLAICLMVDPSNFKLTTIQKKLLDEKGIDLSHQTLRRIKDCNKELIEAGNRGITNFANNRTPYVVGILPNNIGDYCEGDGSKFQFPYKYLDSKPNKLEIGFARTFVLLDGHSGLPTGKSLYPSENGDMIMAAFKEHCRKYSFLPREIMTDGGPYKSAKFVEFVKLTKAKGVLWRLAKTSPEMGLVERFHDSFETEICNGQPGYIGEGIKSHRAGSRPSIDMIQLLKKNIEQLPTLNELRETYYMFTEKYGTSHGKSSGKGLSPIQKSILSEPVNAIKIDHIDFVRFFGEKKIVTIQKGIGRFKASGQTYRFSIYTPEIFEKVNFEKTILRYDPINMSKVYLFDMEDKFLEVLEPSPSANKASLLLTPGEKADLSRHRESKSNLLKYFSNKIE